MSIFELEGPIKWLFITHALAGALALVVLSIPLFSKKGGKLHVRSGWIYTGAMIYVGISALEIAPWRMFVDPQRTPESSNFALFLLYIAIFTLSSIQYGLLALKEKNRETPAKTFKHLAAPLLTLALGIFVQYVGYKHQSVLLMAFPFLGHITSYQQLKYWLKRPSVRMHWWYEHMNGMFIACIATITAFLVTALPKLWPSPVTTSPVVWIAPGIILGTVLNRWKAFYRKQH